MSSVLQLGNQVVYSKEQALGIAQDKGLIDEVDLLSGTLVHRVITELRDKYAIRFYGYDYDNPSVAYKSPLSGSI